MTVAILPTEHISTRTSRKAKPATQNSRMTQKHADTRETRGCLLIVSVRASASIFDKEETAECTRGHRRINSEGEKTDGCYLYVLAQQHMRVEIKRGGQGRLFAEQNCRQCS